MRFRLRALGAMILLIIFGLLSAPPAWSAELQPEGLLGEETVLYLRFDGLAAHEDALDKTVVAQLLAGELRPLMDYARQAALDSLGPDVVGQLLLRGEDPDQLLKLQQAAKQLPWLAEAFSERGVVLGVETVTSPLPGAQLTIVLPGAGTEQDRDAVFAGVRILGALIELEVNEVTVQDRKMLQMQIGGPAMLSCWQEGRHMVIAAGTVPPAATIARASGESGNLTSTRLYEQVTGFKGYETFARGFVDTQRASDFTGGVYPPAAKLLEDLGLSGLTNVTMHFGCSGKLIRETYVLNTSGKRAGLLAAFNAPTDLKLAELPRLSPDTTSVSAFSMQPGEVYQAATKAIGSLVKLTDPGQYDDYKSSLNDFEKSMGGNLPEELDRCFGPDMVGFMSPSEGMSLLGAAMAVQVKDEDRAKDLIKRLVQTLGESNGADVSIRQRPYRNGELNIVQMGGGPGLSISPSYTIHNGWLVLGMSPQVAKGAILRSSGEFESWQPGGLVTRALEESGTQLQTSSPPARILGVTQIDPRPTVSAVISYASLFMAFSQVGLGGGEPSQFDLSIIPHAQAINEKLLPSGSVWLVDDKSIRIESYETLPMPADLSGIGGSYASLLIFAFRFGF